MDAVCAVVKFISKPPQHNSYVYDLFIVIVDFFILTINNRIPYEAIGFICYL